MNWNKLKFNYFKGVVAFSTKPVDSFRNTLFIKTLYIFLLLKIAFLTPVFIGLYSTFSNQIISPGIKQLFFNFFQIELAGYSPYPQLVLGILIVICGLLFRPNYFLSTLVFLVYFNFSRINISINDGSDKVLNLLLFLAIFLSTSPKFRSGLASIWQAAGINTGVLLIRIQLVFIYFYSGFDKLMSASWRSGESMFQILNLEYFILPSFRELLFQAPNFLFTIIAWIVILIEVLFPFLVWSSKTKKWILIAGILMHLFISIVMSLPDFGLVMIIPYILFLDEHEIKNLNVWCRSIMQKHFPKWTLRRPESSQSNAKKVQFY